MAIEIERKFLLESDAWRSAVTQSCRLAQGYLLAQKQLCIRVRTSGDQAWLTIKGETRGCQRCEYEYPIPVADAGELMALCQDPVVDKWRHVVVYEGQRWEIDEFLGANHGLIVAEIELERPDEPFERPSWLGPEVTDDPRYYNANLSCHPFSLWA
ncbi:MAG: CYTH domain-containing protein [Desulfuromonadaceae bacterium]|nr:CYTH domain-containing protein [Desulfuromonadaceae bacterium]